MPASIAATSPGSSFRQQSMPATSPAKTGVSGLIDIGMSGSFSRLANAYGKGISAVRPSKRPLRGLLRMRCFLNAIKLIPHAEEPPQAASRSTQDGNAAPSRAAVAERVLAQEIEITPAVGLQDLAAVEPGIAALGHRRRCGLAARQLLGRDQEVDAALLDRKLDAVAVPDLGEGAPARRVGSHMQNNRTVGGAAHPRVR